jgi:hypothetical protein
VTACKGGSGKTLLSLCLLSLLAEKIGSTDAILVFDINQVNRDLLKIAAYNQRAVAATYRLDPPSGNRIYIYEGQINERLMLIAVYEDGFKLGNEEQFRADVKFLQMHVSGKIGKDSNSVSTERLRRVKYAIVDTSQHFASLRPELDSTFHHNLVVWFIWVYGQLRHDLDMTDGNPDVRIILAREDIKMREEASSIEKIHGRIVHVFNPFRMRDVDALKVDSKIRALFNGLLGRDNKIYSLERIHFLRNDGYLCFDSVVKCLLVAKARAEKAVDVPRERDGLGMYYWGQMLQELCVMFEVGLAELRETLLSAPGVKETLVGFEAGVVPRNVVGFYKIDNSLTGFTDFDDYLSAVHRGGIIWKFADAHRSSIERNL